MMKYVRNIFKQLEIKPKYNLGISDMSHGAMTGQMLEKIEGIFGGKS